MSCDTAFIVAAQGVGLRFPGSDSQGGLLSWSYRTVVNKASDLNEFRSIPPPWPYTWVRPRESKQKFPSFSFSLKGLNYILSKLLSEGLHSNQHASGCWLKSSLLGHQVFTHPQLLGNTKNKEGNLDNHKGLRDI